MGTLSGIYWAMWLELNSLQPTCVFYAFVGELRSCPGYLSGFDRSGACLGNITPLRCDIEGTLHSMGKPIA